MLKIKNIHKRFLRPNGEENDVLRGVNLELGRGDFVTVIGNNGAGKSTLFNLISGSILPNQGHLFLNGVDITYLSEHKRAKRIGRVFQSPLMGTAPNLTVGENIALAYGRGGRRILNMALNKELRTLFRERLAEAEMGLEDKFDSPMYELSGGQAQVIALIMSTINPPELLLLDEHTAALDPKTAEAVMAFTEQLIAEHLLTVLMITHNLEDAIRYGNRLIMMDQGVVARTWSGKEKESLQADALRRLYHLQ